MLDIISCIDDVVDILLWITGVFAGRFSKFKEACVERTCLPNV